MVVVCGLLCSAAWALPAVSSGTLHTHLSADSGVYVEQGGSAATDGTGVGYWQDQSGNGNHAVQLNVDKKPTLVANELNALPVMRFDGEDDYIDVFFNSASLTQPYTVFLVLNTRDAQNQYIYDGFSSADRQVMAVGLNANPGVWYFWAGSNYQTTTVMQTIFQNHALVIDSGNLEHYINGALQDSGNFGTRNIGPGMRLGSHYGGTMNGDIDVAELIIYQNALSTADRESIESYLSNKYDIMSPDGPPNLGTGTLVSKFDGTDVTVNGSNKVTSWNDQVGTMDLLGVDPNLPALISETFSTGTKNVVSFDGEVASLQSAALATAIEGPTTCFVVARRNSNDVSTYILDGLDSDNRRAFMADGSPRTLVIYSQYYLRSFTPDVNLWQVFTVIYNGVWSQIYADGFNAEEEYGYVGNVPFEGLTVGSFYGQNRNYLDGDIAEILVYEGALDTTTRETVQQSLFDKYGIAPVCGAAYTTYNDMDFDENCVVGLEDFADFTAEWLKCTTPGNPLCVIE